MHAIRRQAHRAAADQALNYNPFARTRSRPGQSQDVPHSDNVESTPPFGVDRASTDRPASQPIVGGHVPNAASGSSQKSTYVHDVTLTQPSPSVDDSVHEIQRKRPLRRRWQAIFRRDQDDIFEEPEDLTMEERKARALKRKIPFGVQVRSILFLNTRTKMATALAPCIIAGFVLNYTHSNSIAVFCVNFVAIIPSASVLSFCLNELMIRSGEKVSALLNQTFGNAVQLIQSVLLLKTRQVSVLKLSLIGIILSNLLVTSGLSFLLGGINRLEQFFNRSLAQTISMLLLLAVTSLIVPTAAHLLTNTSAQGVLAQSRGISCVILVSYILWLRFTLYTHRTLFYEPNKKAEVKRKVAIEAANDGLKKGIAAIGAGSAAASGGWVNARRLAMELEDEDEDEDNEDYDVPALSLEGAVITLVIAVVLLAFNTQFATDSIQSILQSRKVSQTFLSLIILPLLSNDPMAVDMAIRDKMNMSISLALERCMQTCLLLVPLTVLLAWCMGVDDMDLQFDGFSIATLFASIIIVTYVVQEGSSNWLTGALLLKVFIIIALAAFYIH